MQRSFLLFLLLAFLFSGCYKVNKLDVKKPAHLIPKVKMVNILTDMEIIQGANTYNKEHFRGYKDLENSYYMTLLNHYHVSKNQIRSSLDYYNNQGEEMADIYDKVMSKLTEKQTILNEKEQIKKGLELLRKNPGENFPFLFREDGIMHLCINPVI